MLRHMLGSLFWVELILTDFVGGKRNFLTHFLFPLQNYLSHFPLFQALEVSTSPSGTLRGDS